MNERTRRIVGYGVPTAWILLLVAAGGTLDPAARFLGATVALLLSVKVGAWLLVGPRDDEHDRSLAARVLYWTAWPGVRPDQFGAGADARAEPEAREFVVGYAFVWVGVGLALAALLAPPHVGTLASTWLALFAFLAVVHAGIGRLLPFALRWGGIAVPPLFDDPLRSERVGTFWSDRWNRPFVGMNRLFVTGPLGARAGMDVAATVAFGVSGLLHELAISYTAGAGWGGPLLYFAVQAGGYSVEQRLPDDWGRPLVRRLWTYAVVFGPLPLLFHAPFRATFLAPLVEGGRALLLAHPVAAYLDVALWLAAAGHFLVLVASYRVPEELEWAEDLASLQPFNRKLLWTYGGFVVLTIVAFGVMTAVFHDQLLAGTPVALGLATFVAVWWTARILVDAFYYDHDDWPAGVEYVVGHALLTSLFAFLVAVYGGTVLYHLG